MTENAPAPTIQQEVQRVFDSRPPFPHQVDNSARSDFVMCPTKWLYSFVFSIAAASPSVHLHAGGAFARGLEVARKTFYQDGKPEGEAKRDGLEAIIQFYGPFVPVETKQGDKSLDNVIRAFDSYLVRYPLGRDRIKPHVTAEGKVMCEFTFTIPTEVRNPSCGHCGHITHPETTAYRSAVCANCNQPLDTILYCGRTDMIGETDGSLWVVDEKTATQLGDSWASQFDLDSQFTGYVAAARYHLRKPVAGAVIRGVGLLKTKITHQEAMLHRSQWVIDRWWDQLHKDLRRMVRSYCDWDFDMALTKSACGAYGGCTFKILCESQEPRKWLNQYRIRLWDPLAKDNGEKLLERSDLTPKGGGDLVIDLKDLM